MKLLLETNWAWDVRLALGRYAPPLALAPRGPGAGQWERAASFGSRLAPLRLELKLRLDRHVRRQLIGRLALLSSRALPAPSFSARTFDPRAASYEL